MDDLISRQAALDALDAICDRECEYPKKQRAVMCGACRLGSAFDAIDELPSAERRGRWIEEYSANHFQAKCSACGESTLYGITYDLEGNAYYMNYCPNCGARMDEVEE